MSSLESILKGAGIDTASLRPFEGAPDLILLLTTHGKDAMPLWRQLRSLVPETGHWPVLLGTEEDLEMHLDGLEEVFEETSTSELLRVAGRIDPVEWLAKRGEIEAPEQPEPWPIHAASTGGVRDEQFTIPTDIVTGTPHPEVFVALVPTPHGWEVPAYLRFGNWDSCPEPEAHVALWQRWHAQYGAKIVGISHDVVEAYVSQPPTDRAAAEALAREQYLYCDDIVSQGCGTLTRLASLLLNRGSWYFWWD
jgi:hypothetical protein